jgi:hypothetical protein
LFNYGKTIPQQSARNFVLELQCHLRMIFPDHQMELGSPAMTILEQFGSLEKSAI